MNEYDIAVIEGSTEIGSFKWPVIPRTGEYIDFDTEPQQIEKVVHMVRRMIGSKFEVHIAAKKKHGT